jgi:hypothetical protein
MKEGTLRVQRSAAIGPLNDCNRPLNDCSGCLETAQQCNGGLHSSRDSIHAHEHGGFYARPAYWARSASASRLHATEAPNTAAQMPAETREKGREENVKICQSMAVSGKILEIFACGHFFFMIGREGVNQGSRTTSRAASQHTMQRS